jgi:catalase
LMALPGNGGIRTRKVALLATHGVIGASLIAVQAALQVAGAVTVVVAPRLGTVNTADGQTLEATASFENSAPVLFDAVVVPDGEAGVKRLLLHAQALDFVSLQYRHCKTLMAIGAAKSVLDRVGVESFLSNGDADPGVLLTEADDVDASSAAFIAAIGKHRHPARETDPAQA